MEIPAGFHRADESGLSCIVRDDVGDSLLPILVAAAHSWPPTGAEALQGGRGATVRLDRVVLRQYRRGGLVARFNRELYFGRTRRAEHELAITAVLQSRGVPVAAPLGSAVRLVGPAHRGWFASQYIDGAANLWLWVQGKRTNDERTLVLQATGQAIRTLRQAGGHHPDLNLQNILVHGSQVSLIDFDRATLLETTSGSIPPELNRLARSARKLDPRQQHIGDADLALIRAAYTGGA